MSSPKIAISKCWVTGGIEEDWFWDQCHLVPPQTPNEQARRILSGTCIMWHMQCKHAYTHACLYETQSSPGKFYRQFPWILVSNLFGKVGISHVAFLCKGSSGSSKIANCNNTVHTAMVIYKCRSYWATQAMMVTSKIIVVQIANTDYVTENIAKT